VGVCFNQQNDQAALIHAQAIERLTFIDWLLSETGCTPEFVAGHLVGPAPFKRLPVADAA
jgi:hypothetical protein